MGKYFSKGEPGVMGMSVIPETPEAETGGLQGLGQPGQLRSPCLKIKFKRGLENVAQWWNPLGLNS